jgi:hypothetical protein
MTETQNRFIELFVTAIKTSSYADIEPKAAVYTDYVSLSGSTIEYLNQVHKEMDGVGRESFSKQNLLNKSLQGLKGKLQALMKTSKKLEIEREAIIPAAVIEEDDSLKNVYSFYINKRAHKPDSDVILLKISEDNMKEISNMLQIIGKEYLRQVVLEEIEEHLEFYDFYCKNKIQIVDTSANACYKIRLQMESNNQTITKSELVQKVLKDFYIKKYAEKSPQERKKLIKNAVAQWVRDNNYKFIKS